MDLERIAAVVRPRSGWEAIDLGFAMVRTWWRQIYAVWLIGVLPFWLVLFFALRERPWLSFVLVWWLKPVFDRIPLAFVGRALFGERVSPRQSVRELPKLLTRYPFAGLIAFRFDSARSYNMPVWQLEGLRGRTGHNRVRLLIRRNRGVAVGLTFACWFCEICLIFALLGFGKIMVPEQVELGWAQFFSGYWSGDASWWCYLMVGGVWFIAVSLVEPFYVAAGFSLYLNRRVALEGWDVELAFRRLRRRLAKGISGARGAGQRLKMGVLLGLISGLLASAVVVLPAGAQEAVTEAASAEEVAPDPALVIEEILAQPGFRHQRTVKRWRYKGPFGDFDPLTDSRSNRGGGGVAVKGMAFLVEIGFWLLAAIALAFVLAQFLSRREPRVILDSVVADAAAPQVLFGLDVRQESLPRDLSGEALRLLRAGRMTQALSLLYRGTLAQVVGAQAVAVEPSWTEEDCLRLLEPDLSSDRFTFLRQLTDSWCRSAYAHRQPDPAVLEDFCLRWDGLFRSEP